MIIFEKSAGEDYIKWLCRISQQPLAAWSLGESVPAGEGEGQQEQVAGVLLSSLTVQMHLARCPGAQH